MDQGQSSDRMSQELEQNSKPECITTPLGTTFLYIDFFFLQMKQGGHLKGTFFQNKNSFLFIKIDFLKNEFTLSKSLKIRKIG